MKTVDIVDKSGLPVAAGGVELTEKDDLEKRVARMEAQLAAVPEMIGKMLLEAAQRTTSQRPGA